MYITQPCPDKIQDNRRQVVCLSCAIGKKTQQKMTQKKRGTANSHLGLVQIEGKENISLGQIIGNGKEQRCKTQERKLCIKLCTWCSECRKRSPKKSTRLDPKMHGFVAFSIALPGAQAKTWTTSECSFSHENVGLENFPEER